MRLVLIASSLDLLLLLLLNLHHILQVLLLLCTPGSGGVHSDGGRLELPAAGANIARAIELNSCKKILQSFVLFVEHVLRSARVGDSSRLSCELAICCGELLTPRARRLEVNWRRDAAARST